MKHRKRDWFRILRDLMREGISMHRVARACGRHPHTVQNWAEGSEPKDSDARVVLTLYARHCPDKFEAHIREFAIRPEMELDYLRRKPRANRIRVQIIGQADLFCEVS